MFSNTNTSTKPSSYTDNASMKTDTASLYSVSSSATTLKDADTTTPSKKKKFLSFGKTSTPKSASESAKEALHQEAIANYMTFRS